MSETTPEITVDDLATVLARGDAVVDVREPGEYVTAHVPGARLLPMGQVPSRIAELNPESPVYVVCASGNRSAAIADLLIAKGFDAYSVAGGTKAWIASGRSVATGTTPTP